MATPTPTTARIVAQPRHPPNSVEAEQSVLGGLLLENRLWFDLADKLTEDDFYRADHRLIFSAIREIAGANKPCDFVTLSEHLRHQGRLEEAGGIAYLGSLAADTYSVANVVHYAEIVRERSVQRSLIAAGHDIGELGYKPEGRPSGELVEAAEKKVFEIREQGAKGKSSYQDIQSLLGSAEARIDKLRKDPNAFTGLKTGFKDLDKKVVGLNPGDLIIIAGRPSMGKTSFAMNIAENIVINAPVADRKPVAMFSMEMSGDQLALRLLSSFGRIELGKLFTGHLNTVDYDKLTSASALLRESKLFIDETGGLSPMDIRARARRLKRQHDIQLMVVDYIQLMQVAGNKENRTNEISEISRSLKALAKELAIPIIVLSQLNRGVESRDNKRPRMSDLRESGGIEQDADLVLLIYRDVVYNEATPEKNVAEIIIAKQRNGPTGMIKLSFLGEYTKFDDLADGSYEPMHDG